MQATNLNHAHNSFGTMFVKEIETSELAQMMQSGEKIRLVDVRTPGEIMAGIIPGGEGMPLSVLPLRINELSRDETVVFYCRTGARSAQACMYMMQQGYDKVYNLRGGIVTWAHNGQPIAPGHNALR